MERLPGLENREALDPHHQLSPLRSCICVCLMFQLHTPNRIPRPGTHSGGDTCHADFQPPVGCREEEGGNVIGVRVLQELLLEPGLIPGGRAGDGKKRVGLMERAYGELTYSGFSAAPKQASSKTDHKYGPCLCPPLSCF